MILLETVFQAILPVTALAADADGREGVDEGFAAGMRALRGGEKRRFSGRGGSVGGNGGGGPSSCGGPFACVSALVCCLGPVIKAISAST